LWHSKIIQRPQEDRMADYQLTIGEQTVKRLFQGVAGLAKLLEQVLNQVLEARVSEQLGAQRYKRTAERQGYRNGVRPRQFTTRVGKLTLRVPQVRDGQFSPELFARYQRSEQALVLALMEMVVNGVSTRKVSAITEELYGTSFSKSTVSALCARLDPLVAAWNERPLSEQPFPFVVADALALRAREAERARACSALIALGVNAAGYREILGMQLGESESEGSWTSFFSWLKRRGLSGVDLVVSDAHSGLVEAIHPQFQGCSWHAARRSWLAMCSKRRPRACVESCTNICSHSSRRPIQRRRVCSCGRRWTPTALDAYSARAQGDGNIGSWLRRRHGRPRAARTLSSALARLKCYRANQ
jgi:transposase-like protein